MVWQEWLGFLAGILTTVAVIPQIRKAWRTKEVDDISLFTLCILITGLSMWTAYGVFKQAWPIIITNGLSFVMNVVLFGFVIRNKSK